MLMLFLTASFSFSRSRSLLHPPQAPRYSIADLSHCKAPQQVQEVHPSAHSWQDYSSAASTEPPTHSLSHVHAPILSAVAIKDPINVTINLLLKLVMSSGTSQIVAPIFLAILIANFAFE